MTDTPKKKPNPKKKPPFLGKGPKKPRGGFWRHMLSIVLFFMVLALLYSTFAGGEGPEEISIAELARDVESGLVSGITVTADQLEIMYTETDEAGEPVTKISKKEVQTSISEDLINFGVTSEQLRELDIEIKNPSGLGYWLLNLAPILLPVLFIVVLIWFFSRHVKGAGMQAFSFGQSRAKVTDPSKQKVTFKDVAGAKEAKQELLEVVDFLKHPKKFLDIGAEIPKGVLLMGQPGTGKTLLARAVAGEAQVPFFHLSGSEFVEMFVGVGASRVRDLFGEAKKMAPAIIFIDEIDAVGRSRGVGIGGGNDEREQTLNQILVEMDGFEPNQKLIVMAATNRPDVLDPALMRPGRFDRRVMIDAPDRKDREAILEVHARNKKLAEDVDLELIASRTPGFSGADLYSLMNEAAILAAREDRTKLSQFDLIRSIEKVMIGPERKSHLLTERDKKITAYHEAGHAIVASALPNADPVHKVSIVSRGRAGGYTLKIALEEHKLQPKRELLDDLAMSLGGYAAELMIFDDVTTGPSNDLQVATRIARDMVTKWGMSEKVGPMALESNGGKALFAPGMHDKEHSERIEALIDEEVQNIMHEAKRRATEALTEHKEALEAVAQALLDVEILEQDEYNAIIKKHGLIPRTAPDAKADGGKTSK